ncbi:hypothetical protein Tco_1371701 [Tanacetum coccineum]
MRRLIDVGPYERKMIPDPDKPDDPNAKIIEPLSKMTEANKKQYFLDIKVMNYILQGISNDIYNSVDSCKDAKQMWERIKRLMHGESLASVYERITTLVNVMDQNKIRPLPITINTKFLNSLQPEWSKYVTMTRQNANLKEVDYDHLFDTLSQYEPHVNASKAKKAASNLLALVAHSNVHSSHSYASPSYSHSPQPYYVTYPSSIIDYEKDYQGEIQGDAQEDKLTTAMMLLARAITQFYFTPTNNRLRTSSNTKNQAVIQDGRVDIQSKNVGYAGNGNKNAGRQNRNQIATTGSRLMQMIRLFSREQMLLALKVNAGGNLNEEENDFMLDNTYEDDSLEELNAAVIMMAHIQPIDDKADAEPTYDVEALSEVNASIIFDDPYVENNGGTDEHDSNAHDQSFDIESLIYNV